MAKYRVYLERVILERASIEVEADNPTIAKTVALLGPPLEWERVYSNEDRRSFSLSVREVCQLAD